MAPSSRLDNVISLCKRRGFVFPAGEIYGGTRSAWDYGPLGRRAQGEHQAAVVALGRDRPRRHRRPGLLGHPAAPGLGRLRPRRRVQRPAGRVPALPQAVPRRPPAGGVRGREAQRRRPGRRADSSLPELRHPRPVDRAARLQHDAEDLPRPGRGRVRPALPAAGDGAGHLRQLRQRVQSLAQEAAVRHRPDRQVVPQRDHPGQLHLPHPRVRADGDGVLRRARHRRGVAPVLDRRAHRLVRRPRHRPRQPAALRAPEGEAVALLEADRRHRVPVRLPRQRVGRAGGHRQPHRLRPARPTASTPASTCPTSTRRPASATCRT